MCFIFGQKFDYFNNNNCVSVALNGADYGYHNLVLITRDIGFLQL